MAHLLARPDFEFAVHGLRDDTCGQLLRRPPLCAPLLVCLTEAAARRPLRLHLLQELPEAYREEIISDKERWEWAAGRRGRPTRGGRGGGRGRGGAGPGPGRGPGGGPPPPPPSSQSRQGMQAQQGGRPPPPLPPSMGAGRGPPEHMAAMAGMMGMPAPPGAAAAQQMAAGMVPPLSLGMGVVPGMDMPLPSPFLPMDPSLMGPDLMNMADVMASMVAPSAPSAGAGGAAAAPQPMARPPPAAPPLRATPSPRPMLPLPAAAAGNRQQAERDMVAEQRRQRGMDGMAAMAGEPGRGMGMGPMQPTRPPGTQQVRPGGWLGMPRCPACTLRRVDSSLCGAGRKQPWLRVDSTGSGGLSAKKPTALLACQLEPSGPLPPLPAHRLPQVSPHAMDRPQPPPLGPLGGPLQPMRGGPAQLPYYGEREPAGGMMPRRGYERPPEAGGFDDALMREGLGMAPAEFGGELPARGGPGEQPPRGMPAGGGGAPPFEGQLRPPLGMRGAGPGPFQPAGPPFAGGPMMGQGGPGGPRPPYGGRQQQWAPPGPPGEQQWAPHRGGDFPPHGGPPPPQPPPRRAGPPGQPYPGPPPSEQQQQAPPRELTPAEQEARRRAEEVRAGRAGGCCWQAPLEGMCGKPGDRLCMGQCTAFLGPCGLCWLGMVALRSFSCCAARCVLQPAATCIALSVPCRQSISTNHHHHRHALTAPWVVARPQEEVRAKLAAALAAKQQQDEENRRLAAERRRVEQEAKAREAEAAKVRQDGCASCLACALCAARSVRQQPQRILIAVQR